MDSCAAYGIVRRLTTSHPVFRINYTVLMLEIESESVYSVYQTDVI